MAYPTYRQDFEASSSIAAACPELHDLDGAFSIYVASTEAMTGNNCLFIGVAAPHAIVSRAADTLAGDLTFSVYLKNSGQGLYQAYIQLNPVDSNPGTVATNYLRAQYSNTGLGILESVNGVTQTLVAPGITSGSLPTHIYTLLEIRRHGSTVSARVVRLDTGQYLVNSGALSFSPTPQTASATTSLPAGSGGWGYRAGDGSTNGVMADNFVIGPGVPSIDIPSVTISTIGNTQQLTAGGFTDPLNFTGGPSGTPGTHVTWASDNTGVATVSVSGLVTGVANGTATITATGKRDPAQTATASVAVGTGAVTVLTVTPPTPASGFKNNPSAAITYALGAGTQASTVTVTPTVTGITGTFSPTTLSLTNTTRSGTAVFTPSATGTAVIGCTNNGGLTNPSTFNYTSTAQGLAVAPNVFVVSTPATVNFTGTGTLWNTSTPTFTATGTACTVGTPTVTSNTACTALVTPGASQGSVSFTDSTTGASVLGTIGPVVALITTPTSVVGFGPGLLSSVGYTLIDVTTGAIYAARTQGGIYAIGTAGYGAMATIPSGKQYYSLWDDGSNHQAFELIPNMASGGGATPADITTAVLTTQMAESYNADGVAPTLTQALLVIMQRLNDFGIVGTAVKVRKLDGVTQAYQLTLDSATAPTDSTRST
jgi:Bacterial Ig-like domain (group 2)